MQQMCNEYNQNTTYYCSVVTITMLRDYQHWFRKQYGIDMLLGWELLELAQVLLAFDRYLISNKAVISTEEVNLMILLNKYT